MVCLYTSIIVTNYEVIQNSIIKWHKKVALPTELIGHKFKAKVLSTISKIRHDSDSIVTEIRLVL